MKFFKYLIIWLGRLFAAFILFGILAYWIIPPLTHSLYDVHSIESKLKTTILLSDQPNIAHISKKDKKIFRAAHLDTYLGIAGVAAVTLPSMEWHYAITLANPKAHQIQREDFGLFVDASKASFKNILSSLEQLGVKSVAIRIYLTKTYLQSKAYRRNETLANLLHQKGYNLMLVMAQLKESFDNPEDLPEVCDRVVQDFAPYANSYQIGETLNRSKWGVWGPARYRQLLDSTWTAFQHYDPSAKTVGPSIIDFEWYYTLYYWHLADGRFDILNTLLYVDRVRQPENRQNSFNTLEKIRVMKAVAPQKPLWITEVNWPIAGTGQYKPTSEDEAVTTEKYRDYMLRYLIIALSSGYVERIYWWQLHAHGYGLIDHLNGKPYPAFRAFRHLVRLLQGALPIKIERGEKMFVYTFEKDHRQFKLLWTKDGVRFPAPPMTCYSLDDTTSEIKEVSATPIVCEEKK